MTGFVSTFPGAYSLPAAEGSSHACVKIMCQFCFAAVYF